MNKVPKEFTIDQPKVGSPDGVCFQKVSCDSKREMSWQLTEGSRDRDVARVLVPNEFSHF